MPNIFDELEMLIDENGVAGLLRMLGTIASAKAEHIQTNWQDNKLSMRWDRVANTLEATAIHIDRLI